MSRLENIIKEVENSRKGTWSAWIYENGKMSDKVICGDIIPFLNELKDYEIDTNDAFIKDFIKVK